MTNTASAPKKKKRLSMHQKQSLAGWAFLMPATLLIFIMSFYPMFSALLTSFKRGKPTALVWSEPLWRNYQFMLKDKVFSQSVTNTLTYLIIQVPIMLILAVIFASLLNNRDLKFRGLFRTCIFLPCATGLVAYSMIFRTLFTYDGMVNNMLLKFGLIPEFVGRVPIVVTLNSLDETALMKILVEPKNSLVKQYKKLFELDGVQLDFKEDALEAIAKKSLERKTGARGLRAIMEDTMMDLMYEIPSDNTTKECVITKDAVEKKAEPEIIHGEPAPVPRRNMGRRSGRPETA